MRCLETVSFDAFHLPTTMGRTDWFVLCGLSLFHLGCFWRFYLSNPYWYARGEALEQGFSSSILLGRWLRRQEKWGHDPYYYADPSALPFLSNFYPPHLAQAWIGSFLSFNQAWIVYWGTMVLHFLFGSLVIYHLLSRSCFSIPQSLFGAVTLSYLPYTMKHNSSIVYTHTWLMITLLAAAVQATRCYGISLGMVLLAGYWPLALMGIPLSWLVWCWGL